MDKQIQFRFSTTMDTTMKKNLNDFTEGHSFNRHKEQYERGKLYASFNNSVSNKLQL